VISSWRDHFGTQAPPQLLRTYGAHGLLLAGGVLCGKVVRFVSHEDLGRRTDAARLGAVLVSALFCCDAAHPQRAAGFASYTPEELWPGADLFASDLYRCNVADLAAGLEAVASTLLDQSFALEALPVLSMWEHLARHITRQLPAAVLARAARVRALCMLGMLGDAAAVISDLMAARNLPDEGMPWSKVVLTALELQSSTQQQQQHPAKGKGSNTGAHKGHHGNQQQTQPFDTSLLIQRLAYDAGAWPGAPQNKRVCELVSAPQLHPAVAACYGSWLCSVVDQARAAWLLAAGSARNSWRQSDPLTGAKAAQPPAPPARKGGAAAAADKQQQQQQQQQQQHPQAAAGATEPHKCEAVEESLLDSAATILYASLEAATQALQACNSITAEGGDSASCTAAGSSRPGSPRRPVSARSGSGDKTPRSTTARSGSSGVPAGDAAQSSVGKELLPPLLESTTSSTSRPASARGDGIQPTVASSEQPGYDAAQHCHAAVHALMLLTEVEAARWLPVEGLKAALQAGQLVREQGGTAAAALAAGGDVHRYGLDPGLWLRIRLQVC